MIVTPKILPDLSLIAERIKHMETDVHAAHYHAAKALPDREWKGDSATEAAWALCQQLAAAPAWHDHPTCLGRWDTNHGRCFWIESEELLQHFQTTTESRYYGPIPPDDQRATLPPTLQPSADDGAPPDDAEKGA